MAVRAFDPEGAIEPHEIASGADVLGGHSDRICRPERFVNIAFGLMAAMGGKLT